MGRLSTPLKDVPVMLDEASHPWSLKDIDGHDPNFDEGSEAGCRN